MTVDPIDLVYTWVDDTWPGYGEQIARYASDRHDRNPNRTRDNLSLLKFSLRSLERHVPWARRVFLVTCRPQIPAWLDAGSVRVVHHDEFMPSTDLPTFNSFAIVSHLHELPGLARRFVYVEDDRLFSGPVNRDDLFDAEGRPRVFLERRHTMSPDRRDDARLSPWNRALAASNHLLDLRYGARRRRTAGHAPLAIDTDSWRAMIAAWPDAFERTSRSRFRATGNVAPEHLYPHFLIEERRGVEVDARETARLVGYHPLNNVALHQRLNLARLRARRPTFLCMNDNYGERPNERAVAVARTFLERWLPDPSRFELQPRPDVGAHAR